MEAYSFFSIANPYLKENRSILFNNLKLLSRDTLDVGRLQRMKKGDKKFPINMVSLLKIKNNQSYNRKPLRLPITLYLQHPPRKNSSQLNN